MKIKVINQWKSVSNFNIINFSIWTRWKKGKSYRILILGMLGFQLQVNFK